jgi:hypothetical protein
MKKSLLLVVFALLPVSAFSPELPNAKEAVSKEDVMESRYAFWFQGDLEKARKLLATADVTQAEVAWHAADISLCQNKKTEAFEVLRQSLPQAFGEERLSVIKRLYHLRPAYKLPRRLGNDIYLPVFYVAEKGKKLWTIKTAIPLVLEEDLNGKLISLRIHQIEAPGRVASQMGFAVGDRIFSLNGKKVADWSKFEVLPFFKKSAVAGALIKMELIPNGKYKKIERVFHIIDDGEAIDKHVENEMRSR